jgi:TolB protein
VLDENGRETSAHVFVTGEDKGTYAPDDAWMNADDNFVRSERSFEAHYFHTSGSAQLTVPTGSISVEVMKGFEYEFAYQTVTSRLNRTPKSRFDCSG